MSPSPQAVIRLQGVSKVFPDVPPGTPPALSSLTADVPSGLVVGLVGPDAAGKTTLMRLLAGLLLPTSGSVEVLGRVPGSEASDEAVHDVGYMPQRFGLYEDLSVIDNLNLHAELRGLEGPARQAMFEKLLTFTALKPFTDRLAGKLSGGMKQKLGLACALLTTPRLLLLDEPGVGVDPLSRRELWKMVSELAVGGMSVLWSTAYMDEAERCAHVLMLDQGSLVYQGPPAGFTGRVAKRVFSFVPPSGEARAMLARWQQEPDIRDALIQGNRIRVVLRNPHDGPFSRKGVELHPVEPRLEDAYIDAVNGYMSYHMIVSVPVYLSQQVVFTKVEIQIRTIAMDFWASLEHKMYYKFDGNAPAHIRRELKECADITAFLDRKMLALNEEIQNYKVSADMPDFIENYK
uniref:ATP-binding cassette domain-containing protein n=1 Tax=Bilophila wadsworthia TaxID=35833 RepID=UPI003AB19077